MSLQTERGEEITVYGVEEDSTYLKDAKIPSGKNKVLLSDGFLEKYGLKEGGKVTLEKKYEDDSYTFTRPVIHMIIPGDLVGIYEYGEF